MTSHDICFALINYNSVLRNGSVKRKSESKTLEVKIIWHHLMVTDDEADVIYENNMLLKGRSNMMMEQDDDKLTVTINAKDNIRQGVESLDLVHKYSIRFKGNDVKNGAEICSELVNIVSVRYQITAVDGNRIAAIDQPPKEPSTVSVYSSSLLTDHVLTVAGNEGHRYQKTIVDGDIIAPVDQHPKEQSIVTVSSSSLLSYYVDSVAGSERASILAKRRKLSDFDLGGLNHGRTSRKSDSRTVKRCEKVNQVDKSSKKLINVPVQEEIVAKKRTTTLPDRTRYSQLNFDGLDECVANARKLVKPVDNGSVLLTRSMKRKSSEDLAIVEKTNVTVAEDEESVVILNFPSVSKLYSATSDSNPVLHQETDSSNILYLPSFSEPEAVCPTTKELVEAGCQTEPEAVCPTTKELVEAGCQTGQSPDWLFIAAKQVDMASQTDNVVPMQRNSNDGLKCFSDATNALLTRSGDKLITNNEMSDDDLLCFVKLSIMDPIFPSFVDQVKRTLNNL